MVGTLETADLVWPWWIFKPIFTVVQTVQLFSLIFGWKLMSVICRNFCFVGDDDDDDDEGSSGEDDDEVVEAEGNWRSCNLWYSI